MADYPMMTSQPYGPFGLGGVNPQQQNMAGGNPDMRAPTAADQGGPNGGGPGGALPLGAPRAQGRECACPASSGECQGSQRGVFVTQRGACRTTYGIRPRSRANRPDVAWWL